MMNLSMLEHYYRGMKPGMTGLWSRLRAFALFTLWATGTAHAELGYSVSFDIEARIDAPFRITMQVDQNSALLREIRIPKRSSHLNDFRTSADSELANSDDTVVWRPGPNGGRLIWHASVANLDDNTVHLTSQHTILRFEDLIPPMATRTRKGAYADTRARFRGPKGWSAVSAYREIDGWWTVEDRDRRFDRPDGWVVAGSLTVRRDIFADVRVAVAAPRDTSPRLIDTMAFVGWHLRALKELFPKFPDRLLIAVGGDPMFRGGLSAPNSLFLHADRPMISGNGTSTILHELFHVGLSRPAGSGDDWIVEGLAEYYSQALLVRRGSVSQSRHRRTLAWFEEYGASASTLTSDRARGAITWRAVTVFDQLDQEIRRVSHNERSLDDVVRALAADSAPLTLNILREAVTEQIGADPETLSRQVLPL